MKASRRFVGFILFLALILLAGILFWPFILTEIIRPTSLVLWLLLRIFVLSIDQKYYWGAAILGGLFFLFRILPQNKSSIQTDYSFDSNSTLKTIEYWRNLFILTEHDLRDEKTLRRELVRLLLSFYSSKQRTSANFGLYEALQQGEIPLPEHIHAFLFPNESQESSRSLKRFVQSIRNAPQKWIRRWTGQETAEHYRMIDEVLSFMETSLEMKNDDGKFNPNEY